LLTTNVDLAVSNGVGPGDVVVRAYLRPAPDGVRFGKLVGSVDHGGAAFASVLQPARKAALRILGVPRYERSGYQVSRPLPRAAAAVLCLVSMRRLRHGVLCRLLSWRRLSVR
jgi:hypothetical protein